MKEKIEIRGLDGEMRVDDAEEAGEGVEGVRYSGTDGGSCE